VAHVRDGNPPQTNIVRVDGRRAIMMNILKTGSSSTLDIIKGVRDILSSPSAQGPTASARIEDRGACRSIDLRAQRHQRRGPRGIIAACLTAIMILVFLGSWRSTIIIASPFRFRFSAR
jgi:multidrug efflux pump subunit AcrB